MRSADEIDRRLLSLSVRALDDARRLDPAQDALNTLAIAAEFGPEGLWMAMQTWVDLSVPPLSTTANLTFLGPDGITDADGAPPPVRWAGRFMVARAQQDKEQCIALMRSLSSDAEYFPAVLSLLQACAIQCVLQQEARA